MTTFPSPDKFDLSSLRVALEHATFSDFRVRDEITNVIKALELDLEEVGFEPSENTKETFESLENTISDVETTRALRGKRVLIDDTEDDEIESTRKPDDGDDDELIEDAPVPTKRKPHEVRVETAPPPRKPRDLDEEFADFINDVPVNNDKDDDGN